MSRNSLFALVAAAVVAACSDGTAPQASDPVSLSFSTEEGSGASMQLSGAVSSGAEIRVAVGSDSLVIRRAQAVLEKIEFESEDRPCRRRMAAAGVDTITMNRERLREYCDGYEVEFGPIVVDLPTGSGVKEGVTLRVPPGLYDELKFEIEPLREHSGRSDDRYGRPGPRDASIRVEGTFNGEPFVYLSALEAEVELEFDPPLGIRRGGFNVTIRVNVAGWFTDEDGQLIDPSSANAGGPNAVLVERNILASLHAFGDHDRDGRRDDNSN
jgi:hypothetical protein